ncbi:MAG: alpha-glucan family phosphorylase [Thermodesulfobacteriota bacterium]|nr:alpha-glucan family phosphorylase [Thermodesulfobacteriota bacterium]
MNEKRRIAYFSMEIGLEASMPTYSGGLGVLAGDTIRSAADLKVPMVAVTLLHRKGYFYQRIDATGWQREETVEWIVEDFLDEMPGRAAVTIEGRTVHIRSWKYEVLGIGGFKVPVYFLDTDLQENGEWDRTLTHFLYGGDQYYRLCQEVVLGMGGIRMLRSLGYEELIRFHMNEGHPALLTLELLDEEAGKARRESITLEDIDIVREKCVFTTHTPVAAGHDQFPMELVTQVLGRRELFEELKNTFCCEGLLNLTYLALNLSRYVNGVAKRHGEISRLMFAGYKIDAITNGVPSLSALDGWWIEGHIEGVTGWSIGGDNREPAEERNPSEDAEALYEKLEGVIIPLFYHQQDHYIDVMRNTIALNGSFFNTQRMLQQYVLNAYF